MSKVDKDKIHNALRRYQRLDKYPYSRELPITSLLKTFLSRGEFEKANATYEWHKTIARNIFEAQPKMLYLSLMYRNLEYLNSEYDDFDYLALAISREEKVSYREWRYVTSWEYEPFVTPEHLGQEFYDKIMAGQRNLERF